MTGTPAMANPTIELNPAQQVERLTPPFESALLNQGVSPEEIASTLDIAQKFAAIACEQLLQEAGFQASDTDPFIPFDTAQCEKCLDLFMSAVEHAAVRAWTMGLRGELKSILLQSLAQDVFLQSKQVVATTVGQDLTPELQFPHEQLVGWMHQSAEAALSYYINEYEKQNGPIFPEETTQFPEPQQTTYQTGPGGLDPLPPMQTPVLTGGYGEPSVSQPSQQAPLLPPLPQQGISAAAPNYDKWAALALFISTLPDSLQGQWLGLFGEQERAVITHYMDAQHVLMERDIPVVAKHLSDLRQFLRQGTGQTDYQDRKAMREAMAVIQQATPRQMQVLSEVERPVVQRYFQVLNEASRRGHSDAWLAKAPKLTPHLKAVIAEYLSLSLSP